LLQSNTQPQTAHTLHDQLNASWWDLFKYPAYSPDLSPWNFHIFWPLQQVLKGSTVHSSQMVMCSRLWYKEYLPMGYKQFCINVTPV
jgi:hypothetical protein